MARQLLIENCGFHHLEIVPSDLREAKVRVEGRMVGTPVLMEVKGPMTVVGVKNANGRIYSRKEVESAIKSLKPQFESLCIFGELDHPSRDRGGETSLKEVSHIIKNLWIEERKMTVVVDGKEKTGTYPVMMGHWLIRDSVRGRELANFLEIGCAVGTSMRGFGELDEDGNVHNYVMKTVDAVDDPSAGTRIIAGLNESTELNPVLNEQQVARILTLLGRTFKRLSEAKDLNATDRAAYAAEMSESLSTFEKLVSGEARATVHALKGDVDMLKSKTLRFLESARLAESGDEAVTPGMQSNKPKTDVDAGDMGDSKLKGDPVPEEEDEADVDVNPDAAKPDGLGEGKRLRKRRVAEAEDDESEEMDDEDAEDWEDDESEQVEESYRKIALDLRKRYLTAESVIKDLKRYSLRLESTIRDLSTYATTVEGVAEGLRKMNRAYKKSLSEARTSAVRMERLFRNKKGQSSVAESRHGEELQRLQGSHALAQSQVADLKNRLNKSVQVIESMRSLIAEKEMSLSEIQRRRGPFNEALEGDVRSILKTYPQLRSFEAELLESKTRADLDARIAKYVDLLGRAGGVRVAAPVTESKTPAQPAKKTSSAMSLFGLSKGIR